MIHLHCHTSFSIGDGIGTPEQLAGFAKKQKFEGLGISEHGNLSSVPRFVRACEKHKIHSIIGMEAYFHDGEANAEYDSAGDKRDDHRLNTTHLLIGALNKKGYYNLVKLNNAAHHPDNFYYQPRMDWSMLEEFCEGLWATSSCAVGVSSKAMLKNRSKKLAYQRLQRMQNIFGENFYIEIQPTDFEAQPILNKHNIDLAQRLDIPIITTCDVHYPNKSYISYRNAMWAIRRRKLYKEIASKPMPQSLWLQDEGSIMDMYEETDIDVDIAQQSIFETYILADKVDRYDITSNARLPQAVDGNTDEYLRRQCVRALRKKKRWNKKYVNRTKRELKLIIDKGFSNYMLIVADLVAFAKDRGIIVGPGRGSACGSLVSYLLGITNVDPVQHDLMFERFLTEDRIELPDIDLDIQDSRRHEVIEYFGRRYGNVHNVVTYSMFKVRGLFRDAMRIFDVQSPLPPSGYDVKTIAEFKKMEPVVRRACRKNKNIERVCKVLSGNIRNTSRHAGGFVMVDKDEPLPLMNVGGERLSSWIEGVDYRDLADYGHVKFDILGVTALSVLGQCIEETGVDLNDIEIDNEEVIGEFAKANTDTIFQFNSWGAKKFLKQLQPDSFEDLVAASALLRPGPHDVGMDDEYVARKHGKPIPRGWGRHRAVKKVLGNTHGILVYQEQMTQLASELGGLSLSDAEVLRKEIIKYGKSDTHQEEIENKEKLEAIKRSLMYGFGEAGLTAKEAEGIWENFTAFGRYGFTRNHSFPYTLVGYWQMYFQVTYPREYFFSYAKFEKVDENIDKAMKASDDYGVKWLLPCVNSSGKVFTLEDEGIRFGLTQVKYVGEAAAEEIIAKRPFASKEDFAARVEARKVNKRSKEALASEGGFDNLGGDEDESFGDMVDRYDT